MLHIAVESQMKKMWGEKIHNEKLDTYWDI